MSEGQRWDPDPMHTNWAENGIEINGIYKSTLMCFDAEKRSSEMLTWSHQYFF